MRHRSEAPRKPANANAVRPSAKPVPDPPVRRGLQLLVWTLVLGVFAGLALITGQFGQGHHSSHRVMASAPAISAPATPSAPATSSAPAASSVPGTAGPVAAGSAKHMLAAGALPMMPAPPDGTTDYGICTPQKNESTDFLPLHRWTSVNLFVVDNAWIVKTRLFMTMISSLMFMAGELVWRLIGLVLGFSYTFDMICLAAPAINQASGTIALYASFFLIPAWLVVFAAAAKRWNGGKGKGPGSALRLVLGFLLATGTIFFIADQSSAHSSDAEASAPYTVPWMATTVEKWFGDAASSIFINLPKLSDTQVGDQGTGAFYDKDPKAAGDVTCYGLDQALYNKYVADNQASGLGTGVAAMTQVSKIWEISFLRDWEAAQFGDGTTDYPSPAHAACRMLEAHADVPLQEKWDAFDLSAGKNVQTAGTIRGFLIAPPEGYEQTVMIAWGACYASTDLKVIKSIPQWDVATDTDNKTAGCQQLLSSDKLNSDNAKRLFIAMILGGGDIGTYYFNGSDELNGKLGSCMGQTPCQYDWNYVSGWLGANMAERLTQGLMAMIVALVFLFTLGPMAIGLMLLSVALAALAMLLPFSLLLVAMGMQAGKKLLRVTGAAAGGKFLFTLALGFLMLLIALAYAAVIKAFGGDAPSFAEEMLEAAAPLIGLKIFKWITKMVGLGDISSFSGMVGFAGASALKATGDPGLARNADRRMSRAIGNVGVGRHRLSALDERSLQNRLLNNQATRAVGRRGRAAIGRATQPARDWLRDKRDSVKAAAVKKANDMQRLAKSGTPAQRAGIYAGLTVAAAAAAAAAPATAAVGGLTLPALLAAYAGLTKTVAKAAGDAAVNDAFPNRANLTQGRGASGLAAYDSDSVAGFTMAKSARTARREAEIRHRNIIRVSDPEERRRIEKSDAEVRLDMVRARQYGAGHADGVNAGFAGLVSAEEKTQALKDFSAKTGYAENELLVTDTGIVIPKPDAMRRTGHAVHFLDRETRKRQEINGVQETDEQYAARLVTQIGERGYVTSEGEFVDVYAAHGLDARIPEVRARIEAFQNGARDAELSRIIIHATRSEEAAVGASRDWVANQAVRIEQAQSNSLQTVRVLLDDAKEEIKDFGSIVVQRPDTGANATVAEIQVEMHRKFTEMGNVVRQIRTLYEDQASLEPEQFQVRLGELTVQHELNAQDVDKLKQTITDAFEVSRRARVLCEVEASVADPDADIDLSHVAELVGRLSDSVEEQQQALTVELEQHVGGITPVPLSLAEAEAVFEKLADFRDLIATRIDAEEVANRKTVSDLELAQLEHDLKVQLQGADPRQSAPRVVLARQILREQRERVPVG